MQTEEIPEHNGLCKSYHGLIQDATKAPSEILNILEIIMRNDIFHSTLDWQSKKEFYAGAKSAYKMYLNDPALYHASENAHLAHYELFKAEMAFKEFEDQPDSPEKRAAQKQIDVLREAEKQASALLMNC